MMSSNKIYLDENQAALLAMFPSTDALDSFIMDNDGRTIGSIIEFAYQKDIIDQKTESALKSFIEDNYKHINCTTTKINISVLKNRLKPFRNKASSINQLMEKFGLKLKKINYPVFTDLVNRKCDTKTKRNALRLISFWVCYKQQNLITSWNYDNLLKLVEGLQNL